MQSTIVRVAAVDDDTSFLLRLKETIHARDDIVLVDEATNADQGRRMILLRQDAPDVLVVALGLLYEPCAELIRMAREKWPSCKVMVSTRLSEEVGLARLFAAGACGYLLKCATSWRLVEEIHALHRVGVPFSPMFVDYLMHRFRMEAATPVQENRTKTSKRGSCKVGTAKLSERELQALGYIAKGFTYDEAAALMGVSRNTMMTFMRRTYTKLGVGSKMAAIKKARQQGLLRSRGAPC